MHRTRIRPKRLSEPARRSDYGCCRPVPCGRGHSGRLCVPHLFGGGAPGIPPFIKADTAPNKIAANAERRGDQQADRGSDGRPGSKRARCSARGATARPQAVQAADAAQRVGGWPLPPGRRRCRLPIGSASLAIIERSTPGENRRDLPDRGTGPAAVSFAGSGRKAPERYRLCRDSRAEPAHGSAARRAEQSDAARFTKRGCRRRQLALRPRPRPPTDLSCRFRPRILGRKRQRRSGRRKRNMLACLAGGRRKSKRKSQPSAPRCMRHRSVLWLRKRKPLNCVIG